MKELILTGYKYFFPKTLCDKIFLGPWCFADNEQYSFDEQGKFNIVPEVFNNSKDVLEASQYIDDLYDRIIPCLANYLNNVHKTKYSVRFWNIIVGVWLIHWLGIMYHHFLLLDSLSSQIPHKKKLNVKILRNPYQLKIDNWEDLTLVLHTHDFHLSLLSQIIELGDFPFFNVEKIDCTLNDKLIHNSVIAKKPFLKRIANKALQFLFPTDIYWGNIYGLGRLDRIALRIVRRRRIKSFNPSLTEQNRSIIGNISKKQLDGFDAKNCFEIIIKKCINLNIHTDVISPIEYFDKMKEYKYWIGNDVFKSLESFKLAQMIEEGAEWISVQHGGCYGQKRSFPLGKLEFEHRSYFISWGWDHEHCYPMNPVPLPSPLLSRQKKYKKNNKNLILVGTMYPCYLMRLDSSLLPHQLLEYIYNKKSFIKELHSDIRKNLLYKPYFNDYGTNEKDILSESLRDDQYIANGARLTDLFAKSALNVIDHNATSFLQSLAMNAPTVIFWHPEHFEVMDIVKPDFKMLENVGIYHKTPESAAKFINEHYDDIPKWWNLNEVQQARKKFCYKYARTSRFYLWDWIKFARSLP